MTAREQNHMAIWRDRWLHCDHCGGEAELTPGRDYDQEHAEIQAFKAKHGGCPRPKKLKRWRF